MRLTTDQIRLDVNHTTQFA